MAWEITLASQDFFGTLRRDKWPYVASEWAVIAGFS